MSTQIMSTKLFIPISRKKLVHRQRLIDCLNQGVDGKLTLLSGPAGFGKTTLLGEWVSQVKRPIGWISLDEADNNCTRFTLYLIKAIQRFSPGFAHEIVDFLNSAKPQSSDIFLPFLINQIAEIQEPFLLVLDDYHIITESKIHKLLLMVLEYQPPQMHLVVSTRSDPPWPLARWRVRGQLSEIRLGDLRFTLDESATFMADVMKMSLPRDEIKRLDAKTDGWVAGLQMAAISMKNRDDVLEFIQNFTGSHRFVFDYFMDEVFDGLPQDIQDFLLQTSILDRLNAQLCDCIRDTSNSQEILNRLDQMNLFVIPLDDHRSWYRYHHLFADLVQQIAREKRAEQISQTHRKACEWYQRHGLMSEAIHHGIAAGNIDEVADLIEKNFLAVLERRDWISLTRWLETLPEAVIQSRPWLSVAQAYVRYGLQSPEKTYQCIHQAENAIKHKPKVEIAHIRSYIAFIQSELSAVAGDMFATIEFARKSLEDIPPKDKRLHCLVASTLGTALQRCGSFEDAAQAFAEGIDAGRTIGDSNAVISLYGDLIGLHVERGQLYQAHKRCLEALQFIEPGFQKRGRYTPGAAHIHFRLSTILRHWNDLGGSLRHAQISDDILRKWGLRYRLNFINLAIALHAVGEYSEAHQVLKEAEKIASQQSEYWVENVKTIQVMFWLSEGNLDAASQWPLVRDFDIHTELDYQNQLVYRTLAQVWLTQAQRGDHSALDDLLHFLPRLLKVVEESSAVAYLLQILIIQCLAFQAMGEQENAMSTLKRALIVGERGGYIWVFVREREPMAELLETTLKHTNSTPYIQKLLCAFKKLKKADNCYGAATIQLIESLTERELDVLGYLDSELSIPEIAETLVVSVGTARTHIKRIYRKLDVHSRFEAITKAKELFLL